VLDVLVQVFLIKVCEKPDKRPHAETLYELKLREVDELRAYSMLKNTRPTCPSLKLCKVEKTVPTDLER
jgi:hypothetical protein